MHAPHWILSVPFALLLLAIALFPLLRPHWWENNCNKGIIAALASIPVAIALLAQGYGHALAHTLLLEYIPFVVLLGSLFIISGGVVLTGNLRATPAVNTAFLATGAVLASLMGTTGASMLLIRPFLNTNRERTRKAHSVVFFIFLVSNMGGLLTPVGDPPLFLGYLMGVPFFWTLKLAPAWLFVTTILLVVYFIWDTIAFRREPELWANADRQFQLALRLDGRRNLLFLAGVLAAVIFVNPRFFSFIPPSPDPARPGDAVVFLREAIMMAMAGLSLWATPKSLRRANEFSFAPFMEVVVLFLGIFTTMIPVLLVLKANATAMNGVLSSPAHYFWLSGLLSSFLDNAPTYVTFFTAAGINPAQLSLHEPTLAAISLGAVLMGANTYIGNGPNFMVRSIAEASGVRTPSFFGYMAYSACVLIPLFLLVQLFFI